MVVVKDFRVAMPGMLLAIEFIQLDVSCNYLPGSPEVLYWDRTISVYTASENNLNYIIEASFVFSRVMQVVLSI